MEAQKENIGKQLHLPFKKAFGIALNNIRLRLGRSVVTASGIFLGIAFLAYVWTQGSLNQAIGVDTTIEARMKFKWLAALALIMSTIGITNSMLMSVTERFKEIGTMKCLGALDKFVVEMFVLEGMLMGVLASFLGALLGAGIMMLTAGFGLGWHSLAAFGFIGFLRIIVLCTVIGTVLTFLATIAPAVRAAKMPPAAALRVEI